MGKTYQELSKESWSVSDDWKEIKDFNSTNTHFQTRLQSGALQRIATATEAILDKINILHNELEKEKKQNRQLKKRNKALYIENKLLKK